MRSLFCLAVLLFPCLSMGAEPFFEETLIWDFKEGGYDTHQGYGFAVTKNGTVLASSGARKNATCDSCGKDLVIKRSSDGGRTWGGEIFIEKNDGIFWNKNGHPGTEQSWGGGNFTVDKVTGKIFFFYVIGDHDPKLRRYSRKFYKQSTDDGLTWSERVEITDVFNVKKDGSPNKDAKGNWILNSDGFASDYLGRARGGVGGGHGIQASDGRLVLCIAYSRGIKFSREERLYGNGAIFSSDSGATWEFGGFVDEGGNGMNECRIEELENGTFYINSRSNLSDAGMLPRYISTTVDSTLDTWTTPVAETDLPTSATTDAGLIRFTHSSEYNKSRILWSKNIDTVFVKGVHQHTFRKNMTVFMSTDEAKTWPVRKQISTGWANYSDLAVLEDNTILLLYAKGTAYDNQKVVCARFNVEWLTDGKDSLVLKPVSNKTNRPGTEDN